MARFKNYKNPVNNSDSIYSAEDFFNMSLNNISDNLDILNAQDRTIGIPYNEELQSSPNTVYVDSYTRADGTPVQAHWRSKSDGQGAYGQIQTTPNYTNSQPINTASFVDDTLNMPTSINDNVQTQRPLQRQQQGQNLYNQNPMPVFNTGVGQMNNLTLDNFDMSQTNTPTLANYGQSFENVQPTLANFDNQVMSGVGNQPQNSTYKEINDAICQLMSGKPKQECSPEYIKHMNEMVTQAVTGTPKQKYSPEDIAYMNKKIIQEINRYYEPPKVSEKENTEKFMNVFTRSILSQMIKDAQNSSKIANGTETGYAVDIPKENNAESFVDNDVIVPSESTLTGEVSRKNLFSSLNNALQEKINDMRNNFIGHVQKRSDLQKDKIDNNILVKGLKKFSNIEIDYNKSLFYFYQYEFLKYSKNKNKRNDFLLKVIDKFSTKGYIIPTKGSRNYDDIDFKNLSLNYNLNKNRPDAQEMFRIAVLGTDSYSNNSQFVHIPKEQTNNIQSMFYLTGEDKIPSGMKGIAFNRNSDFAKRLSASEELQNAIKQVYNPETKSFTKPYVVIDFQKDSNMHLSVGHGRAIYRLTNDGYVEGCLFDKYDFKLSLNNYKNDINSDYKKDLKNIGIYIVNDYAYIMNKTNNLEYYYYTGDFRFKLNK